MSFIDRFKEIKEAATDITKMNFVNEETRKKRIDICISCDEYFKPTDTCKKCGCFVHAKTRLPSQRCPLGKW